MPDDDQPITRADLRTEIDRATVTINAATAAAIAAAQADTAVPALAPLVLIPQCCGKGGLSRRTLYSPFRLR